MKRPVYSVIGLGMVLALLAYSNGNAEPAKVLPKEARTVNQFMHRKLDLAKDALKGIVVEDFKLIKSSAESLEKMSRDAEWDAYKLPEYIQFSTEFRRIVRTMGKRADEKNIDGSANAYVQLTMSCVECHKFTRGVMMARDSKAKK